MELRERIYIGVDCGLDGSITRIHAEMVNPQVMPVIKLGKGRKIDIAAIHQMFGEFARYNATLIVEDPGAHAKSAAGLRSMTKSFTIIETLCVVHNLRHHFVSAQKWQKEFWTRPKMAKGQKFNTKAAALNVAKQLWPTQDWRATPRCKTPHDGFVDAALIGEYGRRKGL